MDDTELNLAEVKRQYILSMAQHSELRVRLTKQARNFTVCALICCAMTLLVVLVQAWSGGALFCF